MIAYSLPNSLVPQPLEGGELDTTYPLTSDEIDQLAARYELLEAVGHGSMGIVFRGHDRLLNRSVALKLCRPHTTDGASRLYQEAMAMAGIQSRHVVTVHDFLKLNPQRGVLVMDWIEGKDLSTLLKDRSFNLNEEMIRQWMRDVCTAMMDAEAKGVIHRDLKPSNIIIDNRQRALVMDFGIAMGQTMNHLTLEGQVLGTPLYMAPEQAENPSNVDTRADIYSFGATFYHAIVRQPPFEADSPWSVVCKHKTEPLVSPKILKPSMSSVLSDCLERCLAKNPAERFSSFSQINDILNTPSTDAWNSSIDPTLSSYIGIYQVHRPQFLNPDSTHLKQTTFFDFPHCRRLKILFGDLTEQTVDVLVSSDNTQLTLDRGIAAALATKAGKGFREDVQRFAPARKGRAVVTAAGKLSSRFVFHGITQNGGNAFEQRMMREVITDVVDSCFYQAETLSVQSMAFPLLGVEQGTFPRGMALDTMFRAIAQKLLRYTTPVEEVRIILSSQTNFLGEITWDLDQGNA
ncbi:MAG: serine/threonine-protein kinase [Cyanobacteria bacterium P01_D01_bin.156]